MVSEKRSDASWNLEVQDLTRLGTSAQSVRTSKLEVVKDELKNNDPMPAAEDLITLEQAAENSSLSHAYLSRIARIGRLQAWKVGSGWLRSID